ncbi:MAG TPA: hypothetical protein VIF88_04565 [Methylocystis sp.]|jgi:hypothetical protein
MAGLVPAIHAKKQQKLRDSSSANGGLAYGGSAGTSPARVLETAK